jgi:hypothetical protein
MTRSRLIFSPRFAGNGDPRLLGRTIPRRSARTVIKLCLEVPWEMGWSMPKSRKPSKLARLL